MRVLLIADAGDGLLDLAVRSQRAGHQVKFFCRKFDPHTRPIGKGLIDRVPAWRPWMLWSDIVICESNGFLMHEMDGWRARGCRIIGGNAESASWELDRTKGMQVFKRAGIAVPPFREFTDYDSAIGYVERCGEVFYSKPCSDTADKSLSAKTGIEEDPTWQLRKWRHKHGNRPPCPFLLQEGIDGIEFAVGAWFGPAGFAEGWEENFEHKKFCAGEIGPNTGEMGTVLRYVRRSKLAERVLRPLEEALADIGYTGNIDVNCMISDGDVWPLEFTMRLGWPAFNIETDLFACDPIEFFHALASGESTKGAHRLNEVAVGVVAAIPPYPHPPRDYDDIVGAPIYGVEREDGWHPCEVMGASGVRGGAEPAGSRRGQSPEASERVPRLVTAGHYVGVSVGCGQTVRQAARGAYKVLDKLSMPCSPFWRDDIGERLKNELPILQASGFATGMEY